MADWNQQTVQLWDIRDPAQPVLTGTFTSTDQLDNDTIGNLIDSAALTSSGKLLVSTASAEQSTIDVLDTSPGEAAAQLCGAFTSPITAAQWTQSAPGVPYQNACP